MYLYSETNDAHKASDFFIAFIETGTRFVNADGGGHFPDYELAHTISSLLIREVDILCHEVKVPDAALHDYLLQARNELAETTGARKRCTVANNIGHRLL